MGWWTYYMKQVNLISRRGQVKVDPQNHGSYFCCCWQYWLLKTPNLIDLQEMPLAKERCFAKILASPYGWSMFSDYLMWGTKAQHLCPDLGYFWKAPSAPEFPMVLVRVSVATVLHANVLLCLISFSLLRYFSLKHYSKHSCTQISISGSVSLGNLICSNLLTKSKFVLMFIVISTR